MEASNLQFRNQLLQFSLFQGISSAEMLQMAGNTRFGFLKIPAGKTVVSEGEMCSQYYFLVKGTLKVISFPDDRSYHMDESLQAPWLIQPESLFGLSLRYTYTVRAVTDCHFILLSKDEVLRLFDDILTFRLNLLNLLATLAQQRSHKQWRRAPKNLQERLIRFFIDHSIYPAGSKELFIRMEQLGAEMGESRYYISRELNALQQRGLIELHRGRIVIPMLEHLLQ